MPDKNRKKFPFERVGSGLGGVKAKPFGRFAALTPPRPDPEKTKGELQKEIPRDSLIEERNNQSGKENLSSRQEPLGARIVQWFLIDLGICEMTQFGSSRK